MHTSDVHIGDLPDVRLAGLRRVVDAALANHCDALLIAGDLFDNARLHQNDIDDTLAELARLSIPTIVSNGNHDVLGPPSIYDRVRLADAGAHVYFLDDPDGSHMSIDELGMTVWARAMIEHHPGNNPLEGYARSEADHWQVAMAHGHYVPHGEKNDRSSPLLAEQIGALGCDYLALGHWHRFLDVSHNGTPAFYSGSPSEAGGSFASANLVVLEPGFGARVERVALGD
jgi:DNA repair exonuclease SbcCD nuclease subunit